MEWTHHLSYFFGGAFLTNALPHFVGNFNLHSADHILALGFGVLVMGVISARLFGRFHGGNSPGPAATLSENDHRASSNKQISAPTLVAPSAEFQKCSNPSSSLAVASLLAHAPAQADIWQPSPGHAQVPIWPGTVPNALPHAKPESVGPGEGQPWWPRANDVSVPTMTRYAPKGSNTGAAMVVFPGGGYRNLAMDLEGTEICDWLTSRGITCVLLKYRVPNSGPTWENGRRFYPKVQTALQDAQRTLGLVRLNAAQWQIDPHRVGVIGFSAGGHLVAAVSTHFARRTYPPVDAADQLSCRPDFAIALYPGHLWAHEDEDRATRDETDLRMRPDIRVRADTPPTFLLQAEDDHVDGVEQSLAYYVALQKAGVPTEMHLYAQGGHAFGLRPSKLPIAQWPRLVETWLRTIGIVGASI